MVGFSFLRSLLLLLATLPLAALACCATKKKTGKDKAKGEKDKQTSAEDTEMASTIMSIAPKLSKAERDAARREACTEKYGHTIVAAFVFGHVERYHFWYEVARQTGYAPLTERALCRHNRRVDFLPGWEPGYPEHVHPMVVPQVIETCIGKGYRRLLFIGYPCDESSNTQVLDLLKSFAQSGAILLIAAGETNDRVGLCPCYVDGDGTDIFVSVGNTWDDEDIRKVDDVNLDIPDFRRYVIRFLEDLSKEAGLRKYKAPPPKKAVDPTTGEWVENQTPTILPPPEKDTEDESDLPAKAAPATEKNGHSEKNEKAIAFDKSRLFNQTTTNSEPSSHTAKTEKTQPSASKMEKTKLAETTKSKAATVKSEPTQSSRMSKKSSKVRGSERERILVQGKPSSTMKAAKSQEPTLEARSTQNSTMCEKLPEEMTAEE